MYDLVQKIAKKGPVSAARKMGFLTLGGAVCQASGTGQLQGYSWKVWGNSETKIDIVMGPKVK